MHCASRPARFWSAPPALEPLPRRARIVVRIRVRAMLSQCIVQSPCRRARRRLLWRGRCLSLSLSLDYSRSRSRSRSRRRTRGQGRMRSTLRPSTHRPSSVASSITLPSCSSTTGSKLQAELGCCRLHRAPPVGPGQLDTGIGHSVTASQPAPSKPLIQTSFGPPGSRNSRRYRLSWLRPRCNRRQSSCYSRPARL